MMGTVGCSSRLIATCCELGEMAGDMPIVLLFEEEDEDDEDEEEDEEEGWTPAAEFIITIIAGWFCCFCCVDRCVADAVVSFVARDRAGAFLGFVSSACDPAGAPATEAAALGFGALLYHNRQRGGIDTKRASRACFSLLEGRQTSWAWRSWRVAWAQWLDRDCSGQMRALGGKKGRGRGREKD